MSVRATFDADTTELTGSNRRHFYSAGRASIAKSSVNMSPGTADSHFRDSLQAQVDSLAPKDAPHEADRASTKSASSSSLLPAAMNTQGGAVPNRRCAAVTPDDAGAAGAGMKLQNRNGRTRVFALTAVQKEASTFRGHNPSLASAAGNCKASVPGGSNVKEANKISTAPEALAVSNSSAAISALVQIGPIPRDLAPSNAPSDHNLTTNATSRFQAGTNAALISSMGSPAEETISDAMPDASSKIRSATTDADEPNVSQEASDAPSSNLEADRCSSDQFRSVKISGSKAVAGLQVDQSSAQDVGTGNLVSATDGDENTRLEGTTANRNRVANTQVSSRSTADSQVAVLRRSEIENERFARSPSDAAVFGLARDENRPAVSKVTLPSAVSTNAAVLKSPSPRLKSSGGYAQNKAIQADLSDAFAPHSVNVSQTTEIIGITPSKVSGAISSGSRLDETFAALDSGSRSEAETLHWISTGHMQAEAGYRDPALGWIGVRAEASGGVVHATLVPQSLDAAQALSGHIAGMHTYLADHRTPVETLTVASFGGNAQQFTNQDSGQGTHQGAGQNTAKDNAFESATHPQSTTRPARGGAVQEASISDDVFVRSNTAISREAHISVLA